jgi:hypothetical protein
MAPSSSAIAKAVAVLVAIGLVVAALYFAFVDPYWSRLIQAKATELVSPAPADLADARYLLEPGNGGGEYAGGRLDYSAYAADGSIVLGIASASGTDAKLLYRQRTNTFDIVVNGETLVSSPAYKRSLAVAPDGSMIAYAECETVQLVSACFKVRAAAVGGGEATEAGSGAAAEFLDAHTLITLGADGAFAVDLSTGEATAVMPEAPPFLSADLHVVRSPSGSKVAWAHEHGDFSGAEVYEVTSGASWSFAPVASFTGVRGSIALTDENLYEARPTEDGTQLIQRSLAPASEPKVVRSFPGILAVSYLAL